MLNYEELIQLETYEERLDYLIQNGRIFQETFGSLRHLNQRFYSSKEWRNIRSFIIVRDEARDLGILGREIQGTIYVHHMNPITPETLKHNIEVALDPNFLICTSLETHDLIHNRRKKPLDYGLTNRQKNDTKLW